MRKLKLKNISITGIAATRSTEHKQLLLRDTGKTLKLKTALKAGKIKLGDIL